MVRLKKQTTPTTTAPTTTAPTTAPTPTPTTTAAASTNMWWFIGLGVTILALVSVGLYVAFKPSTKPPLVDQNTTPSTTPSTPVQSAQQFRFPLFALKDEEDSGYKVSASSFHNCNLKGVCDRVLYAADNNPNTWFLTTVGTYVASSGLYAGNVKTISSGVSYSGEWIQIRLPFPTRITPVAVEIQPVQRNDTLFVGTLAFANDSYKKRSPRNFMIAGSNDGLTWTTLFDNTRETGVTNWTYTTRTFTLNPPSVSAAYRYFRLVATRVGNFDVDPDPTPRQEVLALADFKIIGQVSSDIPTPDVPTKQTLSNLTKTAQISGSACNAAPTTIAFSKPLTQAQIDDTTYSYGLIGVNSSTDGMFVKAGCRGKFKSQPNDTPMYCNSHDSVVEYCIPQGEVFHVNSNTSFDENQAEDICSMYNASPATLRQLRTALQENGDWCSPGWVADPSTPQRAYNPNQQIRPAVAQNVSGGSSCGTVGTQLTWGWLPGRISETAPTNSKAGVNCYGVRPSVAQPGHRIWPFHPFRTSMYQELSWTARALTSTTDDTKVLECVNAGGVYTNGNNALYTGCGTGTCCVPNRSNWIQNQTTAQTNWTGFTPTGSTTADKVANCVSGLGVYTNGNNTNYPGCGTSTCCVAKIYTNV